MEIINIGEQDYRLVMLKQYGKGAGYILQPIDEFPGTSEAKPKVSARRMKRLDDVLSKTVDGRFSELHPKEWRTILRITGLGEDHELKES